MAAFEERCQLLRLDGSKKGPWRQMLKTLTVLEYLMTHGPNSLEKEFREKAYRVLVLLYNPDLRKEERTRARKISFGIRGFGGSLNQEPPGDAVEDQSRGRDSEEMSVSWKNLAEESVNAVNTAQLAHKQAPFEKSSSMSSQPKQENCSKLSGMENIPSTTQPLQEENSHMRLFNKSLSCPRVRLPHLGWHPVDNGICELEEASTCLLDAVEEREAPSCEYVQEGREVDGHMMGWRSDMFTEQWSKKDGMSTAPSESTCSVFEGIGTFSSESTCSVFEGIGTFSSADNCQPSMQWHGKFSNLPILPQPAHPKLRMKFQHQWQPTSLIDCDAKFGKAA